jgi:hypothetical protein
MKREPQAAETPKMARRRGAAPSGPSFGDSVAQAGARPVKDIGAVGRNAILVAVRKDQPRKLKGPEAFVLPAHAISTKNKHRLAIYSIPARGFTAAVSVFWGTPPPKPLRCKSVSKRPGARLRSRWAVPTGGKPRLSGTRTRFVLSDIIKMSLGSRSPTGCLSLRPFTIRFRETKNPAYSG